MISRLDERIRTGSRHSIDQNSPDLSDAGLVRSAILDTDAFAELYERHVDRVYRYLLAITSNREEAADLTQQTFLKVLEALPRYREKHASFTVWIIRIAHNTAIDAIRRKKPIAVWHESLEPSYSQTFGDPEYEALRNEEIEHLKIWIQRLSPAKQDLLALRFAAGLSNQDIAHLTGKTVDAVRKQLYRTLRELKDFPRDE